MRKIQHLIDQLSALLCKISNILVCDFSKLTSSSSETMRHKFSCNIDQKIESILLDGLQEIDPRISILFEGYKTIEGEDHNRRFIVDPVDGTANFQNNNKDFGISIALEQNNEIVLGMIMFPIVNEMFVAIKDEGVYLIDESERKIRVRTKNKIVKNKMFLMTRSSMLNNAAKTSILQYFIAQKLHLRCIGCVSMDMAMLACGRSQIIIYDTTKIWDIAAGELIIREAGGFILRQNDYFVATSSQRLIDEIKKIL